MIIATSIVLALAAVASLARVIRAGSAIDRGIGLELLLLTFLAAILIGPDPAHSRAIIVVVATACAFLAGVVIAAVVHDGGDQR